MEHHTACHERQSFKDYVGSYADITRHALCHGIVDTDSDTTTQGPITDPEQRRTPVELTPWKDGGDILSDIFYCLQAVDNVDKFPSRLHVEETAYELATINCEAAVHLFDVDTIYKPGERIVDNALQRASSLRTAISLFLCRRRYSVNSALGISDVDGDYELVFSPHCRAAPITTHRGQKRKRLLSDAADTHVAQQQIRVEDHSPADEDMIHVSVDLDPSPLAIQARHSNTANIKLGATKAGPGDYYCSLVSKSSSRKPILLLVGEAKAPHKLTRDLLQSALGGNNDIDVRQLIQTDQPRPCDHDRRDDQRWVAAVAAQLYTELLKRSMRYGYITTGESYLLVRIRPDQPAVLEYLLLPTVAPRPATSGDGNWENWLAATPLARLSCLALLSLFGDGSLTTDETRHAIATSLIWRSPRHRMESLGPKSFASTAIGMTKGSDDSEWKAPDDSSSDFHENDSHDQLADQDSPDHHGPRMRPCHTTSSDSPGHRLPHIYHDVPRKQPRHTRSSTASETKERKERIRPICSGGLATKEPRTRQYLTPPPDEAAMRAAPFCTPRCILSLTSKGKVSADPSCPNHVLHQQHGSPTSDLLALALSSIKLPQYHQSLDLNREDTVPAVGGPTANAVYMETYGAASFIFKVRIQPGDYVLVAKGARTIYPYTDADMVERLRREERTYKRLRTLQGQSIPVCAGLVDLSKKIPRQRYEKLGMFGQDWHCPAYLLLGWAGDGLLYQRLSRSKDVEKEWLGQVRADMDSILQQIHKLGVLHADAALRNFVVTPGWALQAHEADRESQGQDDGKHKLISVCLVDFERSVGQSRFVHRMTRHLPAGHAMTKDLIAASFQRACKREREKCRGSFDNWAAKRIQRLALDESAQVVMHRRSLTSLGRSEHISPTRFIGDGAIHMVSSPTWP